MTANSQLAKPSRDAVTDLSDAATMLYGGRYELIDLVGAGGAGTVYRARDVELDEIVALKVLRKELLGSGTTRLFVESWAVATLAMPGPKIRCRRLHDAMLGAQRTRRGSV